MKKWIERIAASPRFWLWLYAALLLLPSALISGDGLGKALYPLLIVLSLTWHYRRFFWVMLPFYLLAPFALYYEISYRVPPETSLWLTLLGSSSTEAGDYLQHINYVRAAATLVPYLALLPFFFRRLPGRSFAVARWWQVAGVMLLLVPVLRFHKEKDPVDGYLSVYRHYKQSYPLNFMLGYPAAKIEIARVRALVATQQSVACAQDPAVADEAQTVVMVIGESARRDRQALFGYARDTSPQMSRYRDQLWLFSNVISTSFETTSSVPTILTGTFGDQATLHPSFLTAFRNAGFQTWWLSNQAQYGEYDSLVSAYAAAAEHRVFLHQHSYSVSLSSVYDEALLPYLDAALKEKSVRKKLIVVHLYGSHADFSKRYPPAFNRFTDAYDNSILYTDYVLSRIVSRVAADGGVSSVMYVSDHGVNLGRCPGKSYHMDEKSNYEVPMMLWASPQWRLRNPQLVAKLSAAHDTPLTTETVMPALLALAHVSCPALDRQRPLFAVSTSSLRRVNTFAGAVSYDLAADDAECHLMEAKPARALH